MFRSALLRPVTRSGVGLHSGITTTVTLKPAAIGTGCRFVRVDLPTKPVIPATIAHVAQTQLSTELRTSTASVRTVEHLLATLWAHGIQDVEIELNASEVPLLDGSALGWCEAIAEAGITPHHPPTDAAKLIPPPDQLPANTPAPPLADLLTDPLTEPITVTDGDRSVTAIPAPELRFSYAIDFESAAIGQQWHSWSPRQDQQTFLQAIAPARTFGLAHQVEQLRAMGLIQGGSLDNALVCDQETWLNPPLRFANEPVRHKILDLVGDLSLLGQIPRAHYLAYKASHELHIALARAIVTQRNKCSRC